MTSCSRFQGHGSVIGRLAVTLAPRLKAAWLLLCITACQFGLTQEPGKHGLD